MAQRRSSLAIALQDYKGPRPGIALTVAAIALIAALVGGVIHVPMLGRSGATISEGQQTVRTLHSYNAALEIWRQMAATPDTAFAFPEQVRLRDSLGRALRTNLRQLSAELSDSIDRSLVAEILEDLTVAESEVALFELGAASRNAMIVLTARQDSALFRAASQYQRSQFFAAVLVGLTVVAAGVLIIPMSWAYVRYKRGIPPGV